MKIFQKIKKIILKNFTKQYWQSERSSLWHNKRKKDSFNNFNDFAQNICNQFKNKEFDSVIEIGTGSGTLITLLSKELTKSINFIGVDLNKSLVKQNNIDHKSSKNIKFICSDAIHYINNSNFNNALIVSQNTLGYLKESELENLLRLIHSNIKHASIAVSIVKEDSSLTKSVESVESDFRTYHHNYQEFLHDAKFTSVEVFTHDGDTMIIGSK